MNNLNVNETENLQFVLAHLGVAAIMRKFPLIISEAENEWLRLLKKGVFEFNKILEERKLNLKDVSWNYKNGKHLVVKGDYLFVDLFNLILKSWRKVSGYEVNFFVKTRDGKAIEKLIILDVTKTLYADTDVSEPLLNKIMEDATAENSRKD